MCSRLFIFFSNGYQKFLLLLHSLHLLHLFTFSITPFFSLYKNLFLLSFLLTFWLYQTLKLPHSLIFSPTLFISSNGTQVQEGLLRPFLWCIPPHPLEWGNKVDGASIVDIPAKESYSHGWICKFSNFFSFDYTYNDPYCTSVLLICYNFFTWCRDVNCRASRAIYPSLLQEQNMVRVVFLYFKWWLYWAMRKVGGCIFRRLSWTTQSCMLQLLWLFTKRPLLNTVNPENALSFACA